MADTWQILFGNLAAVALFVLGWAQVRVWLGGVSVRLRQTLFGLTMGGGAVVSMTMAVELQSGFRLDLKASLLVLAGFFGGPVAALVAGALAVSYRVFLGGMGVWFGLAVILAALVVGICGRLARRGREANTLHIVVIATGGALVVLMAMAGMPQSVFHDGFQATAIPAAALNFAATALSGVVFIKARRLSEERDLMAAALAQAYDFTYVKDADCRFIAVNNRTAEINGFAEPALMVGLSDRDLRPGPRGVELVAQEQEIIASGTPLLDLEEHIPDPHGVMRWYSTSKWPLRSRTGQVLGIAGITRDITEARQLREELVESRNTLSYALSEMSDGLAMFNSEGRIVLANAQYQASFPLTGHLRVPGASLRTILQAVIDTGEQLSTPADDQAAWLRNIVENLGRESEEEIHLFNGNWLQVRTRPASAGSTLVVVTDVTRIKHAEMELHSATHELRALVRTDALTGLANRRAFDEVLDTEVRRSARSGAPLSLLLVDVDRFKAFNDCYGHPAGDKALQLVAHHLRAALKRNTDLAARYGGEEFAAILPDTDEDGAYLVAEAFRKALSGAGVPHQAAERRVLTASIGVATYGPDMLDRHVTTLLQTADEALYSAKAAGRDRVFGTRVAGRTPRRARS